MRSVPKKSSKPRAAAAAEAPPVDSANSRDGGSTVSASAAGAEATVKALRHDPGVSLEWSEQEQAILEKGMSMYASEQILVRYGMISTLLPDKTVREVALRCKWTSLNKKENVKKRRDDNLTRKSKDKKERIMGPCAELAIQSVGNPNASYSFQMPRLDNNDIPLKVIGGPMRELLEHNSSVLNQISTNLSSMQIQDNISLLCQARDNILSMLKDINKDIPDIMNLMPPLPVKIKDEIADIILPRTSDCSMQEL